MFVIELQGECVCLLLSYRVSVCVFVIELQGECVCVCC